MINTLEEELGIKIIDRNYRGIVPSREGERILPYMKEILMNKKVLDDEINHILTDSEKIIRIGAYSSLVINWLPAITGAYSKHHPEIKFEIRTGVLNLPKWLEDNTIDIAICEEYLSEGNKWEWVGDDQMYVAIHKSLPLAKEDEITLKKLEDYHVIYPSLLTQNAVSVKLKENGIHFKNQTQFYTEDGSASLSMVELTEGVTFLSGLYESECPGNVVMRPLTPPINRRLGVAVKRQTELSKDIKAFIDYLKNMTLINGIEEANRKFHKR